MGGDAGRPAAGLWRDPRDTPLPPEAPSSPWSWSRCHGPHLSSAPRPPGRLSPPRQARGWVSHHRGPGAKEVGCYCRLLRAHPQGQPGPTPWSPWQVPGCGRAQTRRSWPWRDPLQVPPRPRVRVWGAGANGTRWPQSLTQLQCSRQEPGQALGAGANRLGTEEENSPCPRGAGPQGQSRGSFH